MKSLGSVSCSLALAALAGLITIFSASPAFAAVTSVGATPPAADIYTQDLQQQMTKTQKLSLLLATIHSQGTLERYLVTTQISGSPLHYLEPEARRQFLASLTFNSNGLTGFNYQVFSTLAPSQIYKLLDLFGAQFLTPAFATGPVSTETDAQLLDAYAGSPQMRPIGLYNYRCLGPQDPHTCGPSIGTWCMLSC